MSLSQEAQPRAAGTHEPREVRKEAAVSGASRVPRSSGSPVRGSFLVAGQLLPIHELFGEVAVFLRGSVQFVGNFLEQTAILYG